MNYYQLPLTIKIYIKIYLSRYITSSGNTRAQNIPKELEEQYRKIINTLLKEEINLYWHRGWIQEFDRRINLFKWDINEPDRNYWATIIRKEEEQRKEEI